MATTARGLFVTSTGTNAGKTFVTRALAQALVQRGAKVAALKPIETGCTPLPADAHSIAAAASNLGFVDAASFYRAELPLAPYAVELATGRPAPDLARISSEIVRISAEHDVVLVEAAGGLLVPVSRDETMADFARQLGYPLLLVAPDTLGVLSHVLSVVESAHVRGLTLAAIVLTQLEAEPSEPSHETNARILAERLTLPIVRFPHVAHGGQLAAAAVGCGLVELLFGTTIV